MKKMYIKITGIHDVTEFICNAATVDGDVTCKRGKYVIDGKSAMGVLSIDVAEGFVVEYPETADDFEQFISQFKCEGVELNG